MDIVSNIHYSQITLFVNTQLINKEGNIITLSTIASHRMANLLALCLFAVKRVFFSSVLNWRLYASHVTP